MAHMIDMSNGKANMAYKGATPWHGLGQSLESGATIDQWTEAAGLNWRAMLSPIQYGTGNGNTEVFDGQHVLYRDDTLAPLGLVSSRYKPVQPADVMEFFRAICDGAGFEMETAGSLRGGAQIWALAKAGEGTQIAEGDTMLPYVLLATSYDGSLPTIAKFTGVRVVCNNTLTLATSSRDKGAAIKTRHSTHFDPARIASQLGIVQARFNEIAAASQSLASQRITLEDADGLLLQILGQSEDVSSLENKPLQDAIAADEGTTLAGLIGDSDKLRKSKEYKRIMGLFEDKTAIGSDLLFFQSHFQKYSLHCFFCYIKT